jgi:hypothetical protein
MANRVIAKFDATIQRNCAWARALVFLNDDGSPFNLTGITLTGQMRNGAASENPPLANVTFTTASPSSGATVVSLSAHDTGLLPEGGSKFESLTTVVMEIDGAHISDLNNPFRMAEGAIGISSGGNSILPQSSAPTVPLETINLIVGAVSASSARAMLGLDDGTGKIPGSLLAPASVSSPGSVPNIGGPSGVATLGPDGLQPVAEMRSANSVSPGAVPSWPPKFTQSGEHVGVRALSVVPPTGATTNKQSCNWDSNSWSNGAPGTALGYTWNRATHIGYNTGYHSDLPLDDPTKLGFFLGIESGFYDSNNASFGPEFYVEFHKIGDSATSYRPLMIRGVQCEAGFATPAWFYTCGIGNSNGMFLVGGDTGNLLVIYTYATHMQTPSVYVYGDLTIGTQTAHHVAGWNNLTMVGTTGTEIKMTGSGHDAYIQMQATGMYLGMGDVNLPIFFYMGGSVGASLDGRKNFILGSGTPDASALECFVVTNSSVAPAASVDKTYLYCKDVSAGNATLALWTETSAAADVARASTHSLKIFHNGTAYRVLLSNVA